MVFGRRRTGQLPGEGLLKGLVVGAVLLFVAAVVNVALDGPAREALMVVAVALPFVLARLGAVIRPTPALHASVSRFQPNDRIRGRSRRQTDRRRDASLPEGTGPARPAVRCRSRAYERGQSNSKVRGFRRRACGDARVRQPGRPRHHGLSFLGVAGWGRKRRLEMVILW